MVGWWWGRVEGIKIFVILFYAPDGERRSSAPLRRAAHLKKRTGAPQDSSRCSHLRVLTIGVLGRIKAEYFNLAPEFTWLCQSNYLTPAERKREKEKKNAITETGKKKKKKKKQKNTHLQTRNTQRALRRLNRKSRSVNESNLKIVAAAGTLNLSPK